MYNASVNNLSPLPFYKNFEPSAVEWDSKRWYAFGQVNPLLCTSTLSPFFFSKASTEVIEAVSVYKMKCKSGTSISTGDFEEVQPPMATETLRYDSWLEALTDNGLVIGEEVVKYDNGFFTMLGEGMYFIEFFAGVPGSPEATIYYSSDIFRVIRPTDRHLKIEWSNDDALSNGLESVPAGFKNSLLVEATIARPEYEYEEEGEERMGFFYPTKQISYKKYKFNFLAPEYLCDVVRMIPLCDHLTIEGENEMKPTKIDFDFDWQEQGTLANVECEFTTNTIVKRVASSYIRENLGSFNDSFNNSFDK